MTDAPTPRTDNKVAECAKRVLLEGGCIMDAIDADFARQLEREFAAAQERVRVAERGYRCFHCKQVFADEDLAREHFGETTDKMARCMALLESGSAGGPHSPFPPVVLALERAERAESALVEEREAHAALQVRCFDQGGNSVFDEVNTLKDELAASEAERERDKRDAERYRWLREHCNSMSVKPVLTVAEVKGWGLDAWSGEDLDAAIDSAIAAEKAEGDK